MSNDDTYIFMEDARLMIGSAKSYYQMFNIYKIPFIYVLKDGRKAKAYQLSAVVKLAADVKKHKIGRM